MISQSSVPDVPKAAICPLTFKELLSGAFSLLLLTICVLGASAQTLTISGSGQSGPSGTNWTTSGTNPVTITVTGTATINTSVIENLLNNGTSVVVNNTSIGTTITSSINKTSGSAASLTIRDVSFIWIPQNIAIQSTAGALDIICWANTDNSLGNNIYDYIATSSGVSFISNGGRIVMAGGLDNGDNGGVSGDGIPDGFAWNSSNASTSGGNTVGGLTLGPRGGNGDVVSILSGGGDIILRGATGGSNIHSGISSQGRLRIESGAGRIIMLGQSEVAHGIDLNVGATPSVAISSSSSMTPAIDLSGSTSRSGWGGLVTGNTANGNVLFQSTSSVGGGITLHGSSPTGNGIFLSASGSNISTQILSQSGVISLRGNGVVNRSLTMYGDVYVGNRKNGVAVEGVTPAITASTADIALSANDQFQFSNTSGLKTRFNTVGALAIRSYSAGFNRTLSWALSGEFGPGFSSITLGEASENYEIHINTALTTTGAITAFADIFALGEFGDLISTGAGNIVINAKRNFFTGGTRRRTIGTAGGDIIINADADANGSGDLDIDYLTFNPGSGNTILRAETVNWVTTATTDKPYINGTGKFTIESTDASFPALMSTNWFAFDQDANGIAGITIGKSTNAGNVTHQRIPLTIAGPVSLYGGVVTIAANLTSSANGDIFLKANTNQSGSAAFTNTAAILKTAGTGTLTIQSQARLNSGTITASGAASLNVILWSDYGNNNNGGVSIGSITTNGGHLWLGGSGSTNGSYTWNGLTVGNGPSVGSVNNNFNAVDFYGPVSTNGGDVLIWGGGGYSDGTNGMAIMASGRSINAGSGDITLIADDIAQNDVAISTTGILRLVPHDGSYPSAVTWNGVLSGVNFNASSTFDRLNINNFANLGGLVIGYYEGHLMAGNPVIQGNSSNITVAAPISITGLISLRGSNLGINQSLTSTGTGNISFSTNTLSVAAAAVISSAGQLIIDPITNGATIGLAGGVGTLQVTASNFNTNFSDGFSEIRIGNTSAGNITLANPMIVKDHLRLVTGGNMLLNEILTLGGNHLHFIGNTIIPATNKFIKTNGIGKLYMVLTNNTGKLYPLGVDHYNPVTITNRTGIADQFYATVSPGVFYQGGISGTAVSWSPRVDLTWNIGNAMASTGAGSVDLFFGWNAANVSGVLSNPRLIHHDGANWNYLSEATSFDPVAQTLSYAGYTGTFSPFGIAEMNLVLPVSWVSFAGKRVGNGIALQWVTAFEQNNDRFEVERSADGRAFSRIGIVSAGQQNSVYNNTYFHTDAAPLTGVSYYRIRQVDQDGRSSFSSVITIATEENSGFKILSAAGSNQAILTMPSTVQGSVQIMIYDAAGRKVMQKQIPSAARSVIDVGSLKANGWYILSLVQQDRVLFTDRLLLNGTN